VVAVPAPTRQRSVIQAGTVQRVAGAVAVVAIVSLGPVAICVPHLLVGGVIFALVFGTWCLVLEALRRRKMWQVNQEYYAEVAAIRNAVRRCRQEWKERLAAAQAKARQAYAINLRNWEKEVEGLREEANRRQQKWQNQLSKVQGNARQQYQQQLNSWSQTVKGFQLEVARRKKARQDAMEQLRSLEVDWATTASRYATAFQGKKEALDKLRQRHEELARSYPQDRQRLQTKARDMQLAAFLQQYFISDASIRGIAATRKATLASFGIETAFDIEAQVVMEVPGFKAKLTHRLVCWRKEVEAKFVFVPATGVPLPERQALEVRYATARQPVEAQLLAGERELLDIRGRADGELRTLTQNIHSCLRVLTQAQVDLTVFPPEI
jgi:hypothetical protein